MRCGLGLGFAAGTTAGGGGGNPCASDIDCTVVLIDEEDAVAGIADDGTLAAKLDLVLAAGFQDLGAHQQKQLVAREAVKYVVDDAYIGVGSGSTANFFIDELAVVKGRIKGAVASSPFPDPSASPITPGRKRSRGREI